MAHLDVKQSQADLDHYKFLLELNQKAQLGLTQNEIINLMTCPLSWIPSSIPYSPRAAVGVSSARTTRRSFKYLKPALNTEGCIQKGREGLADENRSNTTPVDQAHEETEFQLGHRRLRAGHADPTGEKARHEGETHSHVKTSVTAMIKHNDHYPCSLTSQANFKRGEVCESQRGNHKRLENRTQQLQFKPSKQGTQVATVSNSEASSSEGSTQKRQAEVVQDPNVDAHEENMKAIRSNDTTSGNINTREEQKRVKMETSFATHERRTESDVHFRTENKNKHADRCTAKELSSTMLQGSIWKFTHSSGCFLSNCDRKCHRIPMSPWNHAFLQFHPARAAIIMLLNRPLNKRGYAMYILSGSPEVHISCPEEKLDFVLRILWDTASNYGIRSYIPELDPQRTAAPDKVIRGAHYSYWSDQPRVIIYMAPPQPEDSWRCYNFPDCSNKRRPGDSACHIISFSPHEDTHLLVCDFDSKNNLFRKLNAFFDRQDVQISLLQRMPVIHVMGQRSDEALSILRRLISGVKSEAVIRKLCRDYL